MTPDEQIRHLNQNLLALVEEHNAALCAILGLLSQIPGIETVNAGQAVRTGLSALDIRARSGSVERKAAGIVSGIVEYAKKNQPAEA